MLHKETAKLSRLEFELYIMSQHLREMYTILGAMYWQKCKPDYVQEGLAQDQSFFRMELACAQSALKYAEAQIRVDPFLNVQNR